MTFTISQGDAVAWLRELAPESVDLAITDPPYESLEKYRNVGTTTRLKHSKSSSNDWFAIFPNDRFAELFAELFRVLRQNTHLYLMCDAETMFIARPRGEAAGFRFVRPIVWDKVTMGMGYHYRARYEFVMLFEKGRRRTSDPSVDDLLAAKRIRNGWPTEKPPELLRVFVEQSSEHGQLVIDPFMGSASTGVAALRAGRAFAGNDLSPVSTELAQRRLTDTTELPA